jgi:hypothetical protein
MIDKIEFTYSDLVRKEESLESNMKANIDMWLSPLEKEINEKGLTVGVAFISPGRNHISIFDVDPDLYEKFFNQMKLF